MMHKLTLSHLPADQCCTYVHHNIVSPNPQAPHTHDFHELFWVEENAGIHWINDEGIPLRRGDLVLVRASDYHTYETRAGDSPLRIVNFAFHAEVWRHVRQRYFGSKAFFSRTQASRRGVTSSTIFNWRRFGRRQAGCARDCGTGSRRRRFC